MSTLTAKNAVIGAVDYYRAKLEYDATPYGLRQTLQDSPEKVCVVDVRSPEAFAQAHIRGARNIPLDRIVSELKSLPRDRTIVTYCSDITCQASSRAALEIAQKGFKVQHLFGGFAEWNHKGYPVDMKK